MKKSILVLLIAVLAAGMVFAADSFSGSWTTSFTYNLDDKSYALDGAGTSTGTATFTFDYVTKMDKTLNGKSSGEDAAAGEKPWAEVAANWKITFATIDKTMTIYNNVAGKTNDTTVTYDNTYTFKSSTVTFTTAKIHGVDDAWVLDLMNKYAAFDYAKSAIDYKIDADKIKYYYTFTPSINNEVTYTVKLTLDEIAAIQFGIKGDETNGCSMIAAVESDEFAFADDQAYAQAAFALSSSKANGLALVASVKGGADLENISVAAAADFQIPVNAATFAFDAAFNADYVGAVTFDAYYATAGKAKTDAKGTNDVLGKYADLTEDLLSAVIWADIAQVAELDDLTAELTIAARNVLNNKDLDIEAAVGYDPYFTLTAGVDNVLGKLDTTVAYFEIASTYVEGFKFVAGSSDVTADDSFYASAEMLAGVVEGVTGKVSVTGIWTALKVVANANYAKDNLKVAVNGGFDSTKTDNNWGADVKVEYTVEDICVVTAKVAFDDNAYLTKNFVAKDGALVASIEAVSKDYLVENATLSLGWQSGDLLATDAELGAITAAVKIAF